MHLAADVNLDEFTWVGEDGRKTGTDSDLRQLEVHGGAYARLAWLSGELQEAMKSAGGPNSKKACLTPLYWARAREYSALKVRLEMGMTFHIHRIRAADEPACPGSVRCCGYGVPYCCEWPAWLRPSGWQCRRCKQVLLAP